MVTRFYLVALTLLIGASNLCAGEKSPDCLIIINAWLEQAKKRPAIFAAFHHFFKKGDTNNVKKVFSYNRKDHLYQPGITYIEEVFNANPKQLKTLVRDVQQLCPLNIIFDDPVEVAQEHNDQEIESLCNAKK